MYILATHLSTLAARSRRRASSRDRSSAISARRSASAARRSDRCRARESNSERRGCDSPKFSAPRGPDWRRVPTAVRSNSSSPRISSTAREIVSRLPAEGDPRDRTATRTFVTRAFALPVPSIFGESAATACVVVPPRNPGTRVGTIRKSSSTRIRPDFSCARGRAHWCGATPRIEPESPIARDSSSLHDKYCGRCYFRAKQSLDRDRNRSVLFDIRFTLIFERDSLRKKITNIIFLYFLLIF